MVLCSAALVLLTCTIAVGGAEVRLCAFAYHKSVLHPDDKEGDQVGTLEGNLGSNQQVKKCPKDTDFCYALWQEDVVDNRTVVNITAQDCWESSGRMDCDQIDCVSDKKPPKALNNGKFCCCSGNMCNVNVTDSYVPTSEEPAVIPATQYLEEKQLEKETLIIAAACLFSALVFGTVAFVMCRVFCRSRKPAPDAVHLVESPLVNPTYDMENLKLSRVIGRGRYGAVWKGTLHEQEVAVKVFPSHHRQYFINEREIYMLAFMENPSLLKYFGSDERSGSDGVPEYMLVLSFASNGSLMEYIQANTINWNTFCMMSQSIVKGLAHLHTDVRKGEVLKPCISHRDLNSKNILVKSDLSCCLCDLGFAMKIAGSKYYYNGEEQHAETKSITDVGTLRYMAPEVLEGAVNLRDCESSLKQIDIYSLGLVLWEIASRCADLYQGFQVPPYLLPFQAEIGLHPTFEQMQVLVSHNKARPVFPNLWKHSNSAIHLLKETIEDCWDQDAEARLTALCVDERLQELPSLWERHRASVIGLGTSPTVNPTSASSFANTSCNSSNQGEMESGRYLLDTAGASGGVNKTGHCTWPGRDGWDTTVSETTAETTVTMSPMESYPEASLNITQIAPEPLQPHQGRNPCMERNLIREPSEELACRGNVLVDCSAKNQYPPPSPVPDGAVAESHSLLTHDFLNQQAQAPPRPATPIPYVQNAVFENGFPTMPKQPNVPGNGGHQGGSAQKQRGWLDKKVFRDGRGWGAGLKRLLESKRSKSSEGKRGNKNDERDAKWRQENHHCQTEVCINDGKPVTVLKHPERCDSGAPLTDGNSRDIGREDVERGRSVERKKRPSSLKLVPEGKGSGGISKVAVDQGEPGEVVKRNRYSSLEGVKEVFSNGSEGLKNARSHVKTPNDVKKGRFSLYDDRMMVCVEPQAKATGLQDRSKEAADKRIGGVPDRTWYSTSILIDSMHASEAEKCVEASQGKPRRNSQSKRKGTSREFGLYSKAKLKPSKDCDDALTLYDCHVSSF